MDQYGNESEHSLYPVPYEDYEALPDETAVFNQPIRETELSPFAERADNKANVVNLYWQPIEDACGYIVTLYKKRDEKLLKNKFYLLERFEVERNKHWLTLHNLTGYGYVMIIEAEDRAGNIIARTRGIKNSSSTPDWF